MTKTAHKPYHHPTVTTNCSVELDTHMAPVTDIYDCIFEEMPNTTYHRALHHQRNATLVKPSLWHRIKRLFA